MTLPSLPGPEAWIPQDLQAWQAGPWRIEILSAVPAKSLRRLSLALDGAATTPWCGLSEALPPGPLDPLTLDALLRRHHLREATVLLALLVGLAQDRLARVDAPEGELVVDARGVGVRPWPLRLADPPLLLARPGPGWEAFLANARALATRPTGGITALAGRHMPLAPDPLLSAHARATLVAALPSDLLVLP